MAARCPSLRRSHLHVLAIGLAIVLAIPAVARASASPEPPALAWGPDVRLSNSTEISDDPHAVETPDGGTAIVWREHMIARYAVFFTILDAKGATVVARRELGQGIPSCMDPKVAVDSKGDLVFVWTGQDDQELYYAQADPKGDLKIGPLRLTNATGDSAEAAIWMDRRDDVHIVFFDARSGVTWLYYMQLDDKGVKVVQDTPLVKAGTEQQVAISMDERGDIHAVWNGYAPPGQLQWNWEVHYTKLSSSGKVLVADRVIATSRGSIGFPDMALDLSGDVHVVWPEGRLALERVMYAELDNSGRTIVAPREVAPTGGIAARDIAIAADGNDRLHVVWSEGAQQMSDLVYQPMMPGGAPLGPPVNLTSSPGDSRYPAIALSPRGEPRIVWSDWRTANAEVYLKVAHRPSGGVDLAVDSGGISFDPATPSEGDSVKAVVEVRNDGDAASPATTLNVSLNGTLAGTAAVPALGPGGSFEAEVSLGTLAKGDYLVVARVDPSDAIGEVDETNDQAQRLLVVHAAGTLVASAGPDQRATAGEVVYLDASGSVYKGASVLTFTWDFGDGSPPGSGMYVEHVYAAPGKFVVTLTASDGVLVGSDTCRVAVAPRDDPPHAVIVPAGPLATDRLAPLELSAVLSTDDSPTWPSGAQFSWDMGDGTTEQGATVSHIYSKVGFFVVTLTVTDTGGNIDINRTTVTVANLPPVATLLKDRLEVVQGELFTLSVQASDPDGTVAETAWDFDASDGVDLRTFGEVVSHSYERAGTYNVTCVVRDNDGGSTTLHAEVKVAGRTSTSPIPGGWGALALAAAGLAAIGMEVSRRRHLVPTSPGNQKSLPNSLYTVDSAHREGSQ